MSPLPDVPASGAAARPAQTMFLASFGSGAQSRPSFFEMVAQQEMMPRLQPALKHVLLVRYRPIAAAYVNVREGNCSKAS